MARSNAIFNLSNMEDDEEDHHYESEADESDDDEKDDDEQDDSDHSTDNDGEHIPTAAWFTTEEIDGSSGNCSNVNSLDDKLFEGQCFPDKQIAISAIKENHIKYSRNYRVIKSDTTRYEATCVVEDCPWRIRVMKSKRSGLFVTTKLPAEHNCSLRTIQRDHKKLTSTMIANAIKQQVTESPNLKVNNIQSQIVAMYNYHVSYKKAWYGKQKAISDVYGDWMTSYTNLPTFLSALMQFNPGTVALIDAEPDVEKLNTSVCKRFWWAFKPMINGWQHARPVISIDGTFLKGRYNGKLLVAMGSDSNNQQYLIAYALVHEETTVNWSWFLYNLRIYVCRNRRGVCIISDRHAGIIEAMKMEASGFTGEWGCLTYNLDWKQYIGPYHNISSLFDMYKYEFNPIPNQAYWTFSLANNWEAYGCSYC
ncbi:uncharacterized protein LOC141714605 [Apium graveolens]|uniref:uncharacterized protein LOC141714605 n=1 Tax=Apium graveolens TaxID=4045 RepID=UPI003D793C0C